MNLYIKNFIYKHFMWIILACIFCIICISVTLVNYRTDKLCQSASEISTIMGCAGIESNNSIPKKNLLYLQSKKQVINNNKNVSYGFLSYYLEMVDVNNLPSNDKQVEYKFLLNQADKCKLKEGRCTILHMVLLEKANNRQLTLSEKINFYEYYLNHIIVDSKQPCIIDEVYIDYKDIIKDTEYSNNFLEKFGNCIEIKRLN